VEQNDQTIPDQQVQGSQLPPLETVCPHCEGRGGDNEVGTSRWEDCVTCWGAGHLPTEFGKKVLELIQHNLRFRAREASWRQ
jgi:hypothetical protein